MSGMKGVGQPFNKDEKVHGGMMMHMLIGQGLHAYSDECQVSHCQGMHHHQSQSTAWHVLHQHNRHPAVHDDPHNVVGLFHGDHETQIASPSSQHGQHDAQLHYVLGQPQKGDCATSRPCSASPEAAR
jgi:hypothetical protein